MENLAIVGALVLGLTQVAKMAGLDSKYAPILACVIGIVLSGFLAGWTPVVLIGTGLVGALSACGLYSGTKATIA